LTAPLHLIDKRTKMKIPCAAVLSLVSLSSVIHSVAGFTSRNVHQRFDFSFSAHSTQTVDTSVTATPHTSTSPTKDPLLIRAARGEDVERTPVWMMRQAGRHIAEYRELCKKYPTFRQRSEIPEVAVEVSLQPWRNYQTDGCILFSDILTPLPGMGVDFEIDEKKGPVVEPMRTWDSIQKVYTC